MRMLAALMGALALGLAPQQDNPFIGAPRPYRTKLRNTYVSVAAMKRHARKTRNARARSAKR